MALCIGIIQISKKYTHGYPYTVHFSNLACLENFLPQRHQSLFGRAFGDSPLSPIIEIAVRKFRLISEVLKSEHTIIQIVFKY
jgi:hypothetical protein